MPSPNRRRAGSISSPHTCNFLLQSQSQAQSQSQPLGTWSHSSAAASSAHDPFLTLASHAIRTAFGCIVQTVADCLQCRAELSLAQLVSYLQNVNQNNKTLSGRTLETSITKPQIRAALLVLLQHSIVLVKKQPNQRANTATSNRNNKSKLSLPVGPKVVYCYQPSAALHLLRHCRYIEYVRKAAGADAARAVEELLVAGRLRTVDLIARCTATSVPAEQLSNDENGEPRSSAANTVRATACKNSIEVLGKLVQAGFIKIVQPPFVDGVTEDDDLEETEFESSSKRAKTSEITSSSSTSRDRGTLHDDGDDLDVVASLLQCYAQNPSLMILRFDAVWCINVTMFHDTLRAYHLGKLVSERHGHVVSMAGSLVTAALKYRAHVTHSPQSFQHHTQQHVDQNGRPDTIFTIREILPYIPKSVRQAWEQKEGDVMVHWHQAWQSLSERTNPPVVRQVGDDTFEITLTSLTQYLTDRILYQVVLDRHGDVAARVASILLKHGFLESERLAEAAMVPAKDTREVLHHLFRSRYVELMQLSSNGRQYNPGNAIFAWGIERSTLRRNIADNVAKALGNIRLRREHEVEVIGKNWMERAQQAPDIDENDHEIDKLNYQRFCFGLERLDVAAIQLDETLMALCDF